MKDMNFYSAEEISAMLIAAEDQAGLERIRLFMEQAWDNLGFRVMKRLQENADSGEDETGDEIADEDLSPQNLELFEVFCDDAEDDEEDDEEALSLLEGEGEEDLTHSKYFNALRFRKLFRQLNQMNQNNSVASRWDPHQLAAKAFLALRQAFLEAGENVKRFDKLPSVLSGETVEFEFGHCPHRSEDSPEDHLEFLPDDELFDDGEDDPWD